jgi:hypothetical protein
LRKRSGKGKEKEKEKEKGKEKGKEPTLKSIELKGGHFVSNSVRIDTIIDFLSVAINPQLKFFIHFYFLLPLVFPFPFPLILSIGLTHRLYK